MKETSFVYQGKRGFFIEPMKGVWYNHHVKFPIGDNSGEHDVGIIIVVSMMLELLKARFSEHKGLHPDLEWLEVEQRLRVFPDAIAVLQKMEESGGEPDTIGYDEKTGKLIFCDCAKESPSGRRSLCYDEKALQGRAKNPPSSSAERKAKEIGVSLMTEELYRRLQRIATPDDIRSKGGALFCERRYDTVFTFHNGADSYYSVRGFRGYILV